MKIREGDISVFEPGDILLITPLKGLYYSIRYPIASFIRWFTNSRWSHALVYLGNGRIIESIGSGVVRCKMPKQYINDYEFCIVRLLEKDRIVDFIESLNKKAGKEYDIQNAIILGLIDKLYDIFGINLKKMSVPEDEKYFCSELVAVSLEEIGYNMLELVGVNARYMLPDDFLKLDGKIAKVIE